MKRNWRQPCESKCLRLAERAAKMWCLFDMPTIRQPNSGSQEKEEPTPISHNSSLSPLSLPVRPSPEPKPKCGFCLPCLNPSPCPPVWIILLQGKHHLHLRLNLNLWITFCRAISIYILSLTPVRGIPNLQEIFFFFFVIAICHQSHSPSKGSFPLEIHPRQEVAFSW